MVHVLDERLVDGLDRVVDDQVLLGEPVDHRLEVAVLAAQVREDRVVLERVVLGDDAAVAAAEGTQGPVVLAQRHLVQGRAGVAGAEAAVADLADHVAQLGQLNYSAGARPGRHYSPAAPEWVDKPYGFADFKRSARFVNSLYNGKLLAKRKGTEGPYSYVSYRVRLSRQTERGMYDLRRPRTTRTAKTGFVVPSQNEWIKSAYYDPSGGGTYSYWKYPTNPGAFGDENKSAPKQATLDAKGNVLNASSSQPLAIFHTPKTEPPTWCPSNQTAQDCATVNPFGFSIEKYEAAYAGSLGTVGQAETRGPWGTLDQGGNVVEWTDTITPPPFGKKGPRVWRRLHGGIANAPVYQLWLSAVGLQPQENTFFTATYPSLGIRVGVVGDLKIGKGGPTGKR